MPASNPDPGWRLAADVHAAAVDDDLVFLDVRRDAYVCLPDGQRLAALLPGARNLTTTPDVAAELQAAGLVEPGRSDRPDPVTSWVRPSRCAILDRYPPLRWGDVAEIAAALAAAGTRYRRRSFATLVANARRARRAPPTATPQTLDAVQAFHRWSPYIPLSGKCLLRSFLLLDHLRARGLDAHWVFGVRVWPFHAHCWLQCEDVALDEQPDRIGSFTPILVV